MAPQYLSDRFCTINTHGYSARVKGYYDLLMLFLTLSDAMPHFVPHSPVSRGNYGGLSRQKSAGKVIGSCSGSAGSGVVGVLYGCAQDIDLHWGGADQDVVVLVQDLRGQ